MGGSGRSDGGAPYSPCPTGGMPCKILPLGDSITYGLGTADNSAYRVDLFQKAVAAGQHITYVGSLMAGPTMVDGMPFPRNNEGHSGWTIDQVAGLIPTPALTDMPDIILLLIGTNDMYMGSPGTAPQRLASLLDKILAVSDHPLLVVAQITPLASGNSAVMTYNAAIPPLVQMRAMAGKHVALVDMFTGFSTTMLADGVHPNAQGNAKMADVWYAAIKDVLH
jgi:lysophospholipase L1-like esterase